MAPTITPNPVAAAIAAHATASTRHADLAAKAEGAMATLRDRMADRQALLDRAAAGGPITAADLRAAEESIRAAEHDYSVAVAIAEAARRTLEKAEVALLHARAAALRDAEATIRAAATDAAAEVDRRVQAARAALASLQATAEQFSALDLAARDLAQQVEDAGRRNGDLAGAHRSTWPKPPTVAVLAVASLAINVTRAGTVPQPGAEDRRILRPLAEWLGVAAVPARAA